MERSEVRKVTFTGSTEVGKELIRQSADTVKKVSMELGGNAPFIVFDDADLDAVAKVEELLDDAKGKGATVVLGGSRHQLGGTFFQPTVLTGATQDMAFAKEEIFGPLAPVFTFETEEEAIAMANDTVFGLASYVYTRDLGRAFRINEKLQYGMIGINSGLITTVEAPFGGVKESGLGKEGGSQGLEDYLDTKYVCIDGI
jgi:succinate-semialdehyde dehydrogenase/glutarate-semialdehyde dehydrogenase